MINIERLSINKHQTIILPVVFMAVKSKLFPQGNNVD